MPAVSLGEVCILLGLNKLGGAELSLITIARGLKKKGFDVTLLVYGQAGELAAQTAPEVKIVPINAKNSISALLPLTIMINDNQPKVLISALRFTNIIALMACRFSRTRIRTIITEHTPLTAQAKGFKHNFIRRLMDMLYPRADAVVAVSQGIAADLQGMAHPVRAQVIYNPVVRNDSKLLPPAHEWLKPGEAPVVMGIGRLSKEKNFTLLLHAFAQVSAGYPMRLIILGEGDERKAIEALVKKLDLTERVLLPGFVDNIAAWLPYAKAFVCSSNYEGFGNAIVEAMHCRVPVIATDCPVGPREILVNGDFGTLVPVNDPKALADAILSAIQSPRDTDAPRERAAQFSEKRCIDGYSELIHELTTS